MRIFIPPTYRGTLLNAKEGRMRAMLRGPLDRVNRHRGGALFDRIKSVVRGVAPYARKLIATLGPAVVGALTKSLKSTGVPILAKELGKNKRLKGVSDAIIEKLSEENGIIDDIGSDISKKLAAFAKDQKGMNKEKDKVAALAPIPTAAPTPGEVKPSKPTKKKPKKPAGTAPASIAKLKKVASKYGKGGKGRGSSLYTFGGKSLYGF